MNNQNAELSFEEMVADIDTKEKALKIMCVSNEYFYLNRLEAKRPIQKVKQMLLKEDDKKFDKHVIIDTTTQKQHELYFDITAVYGIDCLHSPGLDVPNLGDSLTLPEWLGDEGKWIVTEVGKDVGLDLSQLKVQFGTWSSQMLSQYVALHLPDQRLIKITPIRLYKNQEIPILHGYLFYRLFFEHQLQHIFDRYFAPDTETIPRSDYYEPKIGQDCMYFRPLAEYNMANDFLRFTFSTHLPGAMDTDQEKRAFASSLHFAFSNRLFSLETMISALESSELNPDTMTGLIAYSQIVHDVVTKTDD